MLERQPETITWWKCPMCGKSGEVHGSFDDGIFEMYSIISAAHRSENDECPGGLARMEIGLRLVADSEAVKIGQDA